ncbi:MAG: hypothetical protein AAF806_06970 [Bacteroidota bacterium]
MENTNKNSGEENKLSTKKEQFLASIEKIDDNIKDSLEATEQKIAESVDKGVKKTKSFFKKLLIGALLLAIIGGGLYMLYANYTYSEGTRAGNLIKISKKGMVFKTYEGQLKLGGIDLNNEEGLSDTWSFSVKNEAIVAQLEKLQGQKVILRYKEINQSMPWQGDTNYFIYAIEE